MLLLLLLLSLLSKVKLTVSIFESNSDVEKDLEPFYTNPLLSGPKIIVHKVYKQSNFPRLAASYNCRALFELHQTEVKWPPPRQPPTHTKDMFTMGGKVPITSFYFAQKYAGGDALVSRWSRTLVNSYVEATKDLRRHMFAQNYKDSGVARRKKISKRISRYGAHATADIVKVMHLWDKEIKGRHVLVIGSERPWLEGMLLAFGARMVTTLEYGQIVSEHPKVNTITVAELSHSISENITKYRGLFDTAFSYSSIEHAGLGRYGDPLNPYGDLEQVAQTSCLLRNKGVFFLGFGIGKDKIEWNAHRIYGKIRLPFVTLNFALLDIVGEFDWSKADWKIQPILVLQNQYSE